MDSQFAHLRQRDTSVSMLRVKMSRRRSQSQKENRERVVNMRRQLAELPELEMSSLDASIAQVDMSTIQEKTLNKAKSTKHVAEERMKQLGRWKERKALEKEKKQREVKVVFKTGMYHPKDTLIIPALPEVPGFSTRAKETKATTTSSQSARVTRSMKQPIERPLKMQDSTAVPKKALDRSTRSRVAPVKLAPAPAVSKIQVSAVEPIVRASRTRAANRPPVPAAAVTKDKPTDVRTTRSRAVVNRVAPFSNREKNSQATFNWRVEPVVAMEAEMQTTEEKPCPPSPAPCPEEENMVADQAPTDSVPVVDAVAAPSLSSFAPKDFIFQAPTGLSSFKFNPLTPRSADSFLTPSMSLPEVPAFNIEPQAPPTPGSPLHSKHDVPYFRSVIVNETEGLMTLCVHWEPNVEDESIPEEMRNSMRTVVGQARLLMKERFKQFSGLVDDCELGRGEKITTCTDLQGFWDMVYYQVEDVYKKFAALKEAESRGWAEEDKPQPPPRQRKAVKPSAAPAKPTGTKGAAKSRLAAVKAAMKAKQQAAEAEKAAKDGGGDEDDPSLTSEEPQSRAEPQPAVVFDGGFFQVESPGRPPSGLRRSSRLSGAVQPQASPCPNYLSPRRVTLRSLAVAQSPLYAVASPARPVYTPARFRLTLDQTPAPAPKSHHGTPQSRKDTVNVSLCFSPVKAASASCTPATVCSLPSINVEEEDEEEEEQRGEPDEAVDVDLPLSPTVSPAPSFTLSPCGSPSRPALSPPPAVRGLVEARESVYLTPDNLVVEELPGLDFERYLQPSLRCSLSPREALSSMVDVEMESPRSQTEDLQEPAHPAVPSALNLQSPQSQTAESGMLLFTPDLKDRIRQSVCPSDLMVFTPPL
ncbi:disks large-associated protein 5 isoform X2 [Pseudoliparis swirei]|uniref:disks large-associated protein 5 isoform X2 n=1 Tax=Pseudoliparis swirei TaxID=2059687 RepID=UPI0024BDB479|nr:disks large-associated protein 5 isoform X2 [Pseudoliparis swirei]